MKHASKDTRQRALAAYEQGGRTQTEIAQLFGVTLRTFQRWRHEWIHQGKLEPLAHSGRPAVFTGELAERLKQAVENNPDATLEELAKQTGEGSRMSVSRAFDRMGYSLKKDFKSRRTRSS